MMTQKRFAPARLIPFLCLLLLPFGAIALGIMLLAVNTLFNAAFAVTFGVLPLCFILLLWPIWMTGKPKAWLRVLLSVVLSVVFLLSVLFMIAVGKHEMLDCYEGDDMTVPYTEMQKKNSFMPPLSDVGAPEETAYYDYFSQQMGFFTCDAEILICRYGEDAYQQEKARVETAYTFQTQPMEACGYTCDPTATLDGYTFQILADTEGAPWNESYPKIVNLIATNDATHEIVYLYFCDDDLDYIEDMAEFIRNDCGWKHIR